MLVKAEVYTILSKLMLQTYCMHLFSKLFPIKMIEYQLLTYTVLDDLFLHITTYKKIHLINYFTVAMGKYSIIVSQSKASDCSAKES